METKILYPIVAAICGWGLIMIPAGAQITYIDAVEGASGNTFATGGSPADTSWESGSNSSSTDEDQWVKRTLVAGNGDTLFQASHGLPDTIPQLTTQITGLADGDYDIWVFYWDQVVSTSQNWTISAGTVSGSLTSYSSPGEPAVSGATTAGVSDAGTLSFTTDVDVIVNAGQSSERRMFGVRLGEVTVSGGAAVEVYVDNLIGNGSSNRTWFDGVGHAPASGGGGDPPELGDRVFGVEFNRDDALGAPSQSRFRIVSGSTTQVDNAASYAKAIGSRLVTVSQPDGTNFEFRGANTDSLRAIPGGDTSRSFLVADFVATREGAIDLGITGLAAGDYVFRSYHLDTFTGSGLGFAQGISTTTPNTIEARIGGVLQGSVQPTALGSAGLGTTFINDAQIPTLGFTFSHDGVSPLTIELRSTDANGSDNFLLLNGFELFQANP